MSKEIDIKETELYANYPKVLQILLRDHSRFAHFKELHKTDMRKIEVGTHVDDPCNLIIWATDDYAANGDGYKFHEPITIEKIVGDNGMIIRPRCVKSAAEQTQRAKDKAEVFTPSWVCNNQNNLIDEAWFGRKDVFNKEITTEEGVHTWEPTEGKISFEGTGKTWEAYIRDTRLEITCGEAPYLVSRYDTTTGEEIALERRIGLLDRKMRIINENVDNLSDWKKWAKIACHNIYGFEWQGDNLLLAREALFYTLLDYYEDIQKRLGLKPKKLHIATMQSFAYIISWNIWQMDGLKFVIPETCHEYEEVIDIPASLFEKAKELRKTCQCPGCTSGDNLKHNGIYAKIRDWGVFDNDHKDKNGKTGKERCDRRFIDIYNETKNKK